MSLRFGWRPDTPDGRDKIVGLDRIASLPQSLDLRSGFPPCYDQGDLGSCTANAIAGVMEFDQIKQKLAYEFTPSRMFIYYQERVIEGDVASDSGAMIRDGIKAVNSYGAPPESDWPYDIEKFQDEPPKVAYTDARFHKALEYARVPISLPYVKAVLAQGFPIVWGFTVYDSFMTDQVAATGVVPIPDMGDESVLGGHATVICGYNDVPWVDKATGHKLPQGLIIRNSWGHEWGLNGYFIMPYMYVNPSYSDDYWQIDVVK